MNSLSLDELDALVKNAKNEESRVLAEALLVLAKNNELLHQIYTELGKRHSRLILETSKIPEKKP